MNQALRKLQILTAAAVVTPWVGLYIAVITFWPPAASETSRSAVNRELAIALALPAAAWAAAALMLLQRWWVRAGCTTSTMDAPGRLLATVAGALPEHRREWGVAMSAELAGIADPAHRWRFALSCVGATLRFPRRIRLTVAGPASVVIGGVATAAVLTIGILVRDAGAAAYLPPASAAFLVGVLLLYLWTAMSTPRSADDRKEALAGLAAAFAYLGGLALLVHIGYLLAAGPQQEMLGLAFTWLELAPVAACFFSAFLAAKRSARSGWRAGIWSAIACPLFAYAFWLFETLRMYAVNGGLVFFGDGAPEAENLDAALFWCLGVVPVLALPFVVFGAALGERLGRRPSGRTE